MRKLLPALVLVLALSACGGPETGEPAPDAEAAPEVMTINWDDLMPPGEVDRIRAIYDEIQGLSEGDHFGGQQPQMGTFNVQEELIGQTVRMPGFILPLETEPGGEVRDFLLVPYFGACIHTPPPPPNQIVYVRAETPITVERMWDAVWVTGVMRAERNMNALGNAAYTMDLVSHETYRPD